MSLMYIINFIHLNYQCHLGSKPDTHALKEIQNGIWAMTLYIYINNSIMIGQKNE